MELQRLGAEQERGLGGVPGQLRGGFGCSVMPPAFPAPCGPRRALLKGNALPGLPLIIQDFGPCSCSLAACRVCSGWKGAGSSRDSARFNPCVSPNIPTPPDTSRPWAGGPGRNLGAASMAWPDTPPGAAPHPHGHHKPHPNPIQTPSKPRRPRGAPPSDPGAAPTAGCPANIWAAPLAVPN